jgi:hypothetical protein
VSAVFARTGMPPAEPVHAPSSREEKVGGKGRPTPKRREVEKGRRRAVAAPKDRKDAYRRARTQQRADRAKSMQALRAGDERHLPARDRGPVRRYVRDMVDARRSVAEFFLPLALLILVLTFTSSPALELIGSSLWVALVVLIILDSVVLVTRLRRGLKRAFPDESHRGTAAYAMMRSMHIRRFRLPPPRVKPGRRRR